jgi:hypothetical protein
MVFARLGVLAALGPKRSLENGEDRDEMIES